LIHFAQALFFHLRTNREELAGVKAQFLRQAEARRAVTGSNGLPNESKDHATEMAASPAYPASQTQILGPNGQMLTLPTALSSSSGSQPPNHPRQPWEYVEEIGSLLKTAFPLLALTLETIGDQISMRFKPQPDEDVYRIISALSNDALQVRNTLSVDTITRMLAL